MASPREGEGSEDRGSGAEDHLEVKNRKCELSNEPTAGGEGPQGEKGLPGCHNSG